MKLEELKKIREVIDKEIEKMEKNTEAQRKFVAKKKTQSNMQKKGIVYEDGKKKIMTLKEFIDKYSGTFGVIYYTDGTVGGNVMKFGGYDKYPEETRAGIFWQPEEKLSK